MGSSSAGGHQEASWRKSKTTGFRDGRKKDFSEALKDGFVKFAATQEGLGSC